MYIEAPEVYAKSCTLCKKYYYSNGVILTDIDGNKIERPENDKPNCKLCPKYDEKTDKIWQKFTPMNAYYFKVFLIAHHFGVLPREGGADNQDPKVMEIIIILKEMFIKHKELNDLELQMKFMHKCWS